jgi:hypothetical protein
MQAARWELGVLTGWAQAADAAKNGGLGLWWFTVVALFLFELQQRWLCDQGDDAGSEGCGVEEQRQIN